MMYQIFVTIASLLWVRGFLLPSPIRQPEMKVKKDLLLCDGYYYLSQCDTSTSLGASMNRNYRGNEIGTDSNLPIKDSDLKPAARTTSAKGHPIQVVKKRRKTWNEYYPRLKEFYAKHGHSNVTAEGDTDLFDYTKSLRNNYRRQICSNTTQVSVKSSNRKTQRLSEEKIQALKEIQFVWCMPKKKKTWEEYYPRLQKFHMTHGHCNVTPEDDKDLHQYVVSLRKNYIPFSATEQPTTSRSKSKRRLPDDKLRALKDLNFSWDICAPPGAVRPGGRTWEDYFPRLEAYFEEHGHSNVRPDHDKDLFKYVSSLRKNYRHQHLGNSVKSESGRYWLPDEKMLALKDLNFPWYDNSSPTRTMKLRRRIGSKFRRRRPRRTWEKYYPKLEAFYKTHGHCNVTSAKDDDLFRWIRSLKRRQSLPVDKLQDLQRLGVTLQKPSERRMLEMNEMIPRLKVHQERYGRLSVGKNEDNDLSLWTTRYVRQKGYAQLWELLGFSTQDGKWRKGYWDKMYRKLSDHRRETGNCRIDLTADYELKYFVRDQRREYLRWRSGLPSILTEDRIDSLERIGFEWVKSSDTTRKSHETRWNEMVEELRLYRKQHGHTKIPQEYEVNPQLGRWVMNQRTFYRMNQLGIYTTLSDDRIAQLEELGFEWSVRDKQWSIMFGRLKDYQKLHGHLTIEASDFVNEDLRQWLNEQRYFYKSDTMTHRLNDERIEALESLSGFRWSGRRAKIPTKDDWSQLLGAIRERGISPETKAKEHWFDGVNPFEDEVKSVYSDDELVALWNEENEDDDDDGFFEDEDSRLFLRA
jgi:hypothetical protein